MAIRPIRLFGDPILLTEAEPVTDFDRPLRQLVKDLTETLRDAGGAGLAAPQIGVGLTGGRLHGTHRRSRRLPTGHEPMTAVTTTPAGTAAEPRARFRDLLAAEWLKFWSLRSTPWSFVISALVILGLNAGAAYEHDRYWHMNHMSPARFI